MPAGVICAIIKSDDAKTKEVWDFIHANSNYYQTLKKGFYILKLSAASCTFKEVINKNLHKNFK